MAMAAALSIHAALVLPFLTRPSTQIRIQQPELAVTIAPPSRETQPDAANQASALHTQGEQRRTTTPGRVILNQNAATQTRGHAGFSGRLTGYKILNSSGMAELDQAAIELLKRASPFDPFPNALVAYQTELTITRIWQFNQGQHTLR